MSRRGKKSEQTVKIGKAARTAKRANAADSKNGLPSSYWKACEVARVGQYKQARAAYTKLERSVSKVNSDARLRALIQNDLAVIAAMQGQLSEASEKWRGRQTPTVHLALTGRQTLCHEAWERRIIAKCETFH
jgi:hypothetical protein